MKNHKYLVFGIEDNPGGGEMVNVQGHSVFHNITFLGL
jgi:hypothetical protein